MFLDWNIVIAGILGVPFVIIILIPTLIAIGYLIYLIILTANYKSKLGLKNIQGLLLEETTTIPEYEPAIMGYLVNYQKIGRREICSTLFDLIGRNVIKITLKNGFVSDEKAEYILEINEEAEALKKYEEELIKYLFKNGKKIKSETLNERLYKNNLNEKFFNKFLKLIQEDAKEYDFFNKRTAKRKVRVYKIIDKVVTIIASVMSALCALGLNLIDGADDLGFVIIVLILFLGTAGILWCLKFLISFMFNLSCYYNDFSKQGNEDYKKWMSFKKYLKNCSTIPDHPLMGVMVWERYYAYAIGLKCSKKFFKQMKAMKVVDNSIDIGLFETFNEVVSCIGTSSKRIKSISIDKYGGSHVDY